MQEDSARQGPRPLPLIAGPAPFLLSCLIPAPDAFGGTSWVVLGLTAWMAIWWALEAVPLAVTALLPLATVPVIGVPDAAGVIAEYANSSVFLILGGFLVALAMERCGLHKRIAYNIVARIGSEARALVLGVMISTAIVSMWVSNTSTCLMMLPVATSIASLVAPAGRDLNTEERNFVAAMMVAVAYAATIGGMGTLIGTPTNALVQGFAAKSLGIELTFASWLLIGMPIVALLLPAAWWLVCFVALPCRIVQQRELRSGITQALRDLGPMSSAERRVALIGSLAAIAWVLRPLITRLPGAGGVSDMTIGIIAGASLYLVRESRGARRALLGPEDLRRVPWDILLLFGGGLALAAAIQSSTLAVTLGNALQSFGVWPLLLLVLLVVSVLVLWTELNSNVAAAATFMPILAALAAATNYPAITLVAPAALAASAGFMMPVGTPANAIVFATGRITLRQMLRAGALVDLAAIVIIAGVGWAVAPLLAD